jgi:hypothetical protein
MAYTANKPLSEYGDSNSEHHVDRHQRELEAQQEAALREEPPKLVVADGPGNLYVVAWSYGDLPVPHECHGHWNHKGKASEAIRGAMARLRQEESAKQAQAEQVAEQKLMQEEIAAEQKRMEEEAKAAEEAAKAAEEVVEEKPQRKTRTRKATQ